MTSMRRGGGLILCLLPGALCAQEDLDALIRERLNAQERARSAQHHIEQLDDDSRELLQEYRDGLAELRRLRVHHEQLEEQIARQREQLDARQQDLEQADSMRVELSPRLREMVETLAAFIEIDLPFLRELRRERVQDLRVLLDDPAVSLPEKYRRIMDAYRLEVDYGGKLHAAEGRLHIDGETLNVELLRIGRLALYYQTPDGTRGGYWDRSDRSWKALPAGFRHGIEQGLRVARRQAPPDLIRLPIPILPSAQGVSPVSSQVSPQISLGRHRSP